MTCPQEPNMSAFCFILAAGIPAVIRLVVKHCWSIKIYKGFNSTTAKKKIIFF